MEDGKWGHIEAGPSGKEWNGMVGQVGDDDDNYDDDDDNYDDDDANVILRPPGVMSTLLSATCSSPSSGFLSFKPPMLEIFSSDNSLQNPSAGRDDHV